MTGGVRNLLIAGALLALAACAKGPLVDLPTRSTPLPDLLPPMKVFTSAPAQKSRTHANLDLSRDFLELTFSMESGKPIERLTRFSGPITVALAQTGRPRFQRDLDELLTRLQTEAGLDIKQTDTGRDANIVIETLPREKLQKTVPQAACFVVPRVTSWDEFRRSRRNGQLDWSTLDRRHRATVFIPDDVAPQEARDCLHEEIAQALGPLNDIYRLGDSVFNDDNMNTVLTGFDMLILRLYYAPELKNGMTRDEAAAALPALLKRINPSGETVASDGLDDTPRYWIDTLEAAVGPRSSRGKRLHRAREAVKFAHDAKWQDNRMGFSLFALGRLALGQDPSTAIDSFLEAYKVYVDLYGTDDIHTAHVALQLAALALSGGDADTALTYINDSIPAVSRAQNAALLGAFLMIKAEALEFKGHQMEAATVRLDSIGWARYGFASDDEIRARLQETAALRPGVK